MLPVPCQILLPNWASGILKQLFLAGTTLGICSAAMSLSRQIKHRIRTGRPDPETSAEVAGKGHYDGNGLQVHLWL
jgi:hypothetical protein